MRHALQGPTLTMKIHEYSLMKDVAASQLRPRVPQSLWQVGCRNCWFCSVLWQSPVESVSVSDS